MNKRKKALAVLGVVSVLFASFALVYAATWTPDDMAVYMQDVGRHKLWQTNWILYKQILPELDEVFSMVYEKGADETLDIQIQTILQDTHFATSTSPVFEDTQIGGSDKTSSAYVNIIFRGQPVEPNYFYVTILDGNRYDWTEIEGFYPSLLFGYVYVSAPSGVVPGSYLVRVDVGYDIYGRTFSGTATYTIECSSTTT